MYYDKFIKTYLKYLLLYIKYICTVILANCFKKCLQNIFLYSELIKIVFFNYNKIKN